ncbi:MAG: RNA polymerase sigma factor [Proteobacteria bacterium]|nr:RNA polymerase sigma factor [Pseudomonadota bacterium]
MLLYLEDKQLVQRMLTGDQRAFDQFFTENFQRLYRFALSRVPDDPESCREVVNSALSKAIRNLHKFRGEAALFTWLCAICRNEISDWLEQQGRYRQHILLTEDFPEIRAAVDSFQTPLADDPEWNMQRLEFVRLIHVALDRLPARYGDALEWKYIEGYSIREIAGRMGIGEEAVQSLLARARRAFHDVYGSLTTHDISSRVST